MEVVNIVMFNLKLKKMKLNFVEKATENSRDAKMVVPFLLTENEASQVKGGAGIIVVCKSVTISACSVNIVCKTVKKGNLNKFLEIYYQLKQNQIKKK